VKQICIIICSAQEHLSVKQKIDNRERFLRALLKYADESSKSNPHFHRTEMIQRLSISEGDFNIVQKRLGDKYCRYVDQHGGDARYEICVSECLALRDQLEQEKIQERRHKQLFWIALAAMLAAVLGAVLTLWFQIR